MPHHQTTTKNSPFPWEGEGVWGWGLIWHTRPNNDNKYLYNQKELQDDVLSSTGLNWYDYGARMYDPQLGRWHVVDPLAEKYYSFSLYNYVLNSPIKYIDPDGKRVVLAGGPANRHVSAKTLMQIAATNRGGEILNALINHKSTFTVGRSWSIEGNRYYENEGRISYTSIYGGYYSLTEVGKTNATVRLGHEMKHAYDLRDIPFYLATSVAKNNERTLEHSAVNFDNYLRDVFGISDKRVKYTFRDGSKISTPTNTNPHAEKITGFQLLNFDATNPFSADLLSPKNPLEATYQKTIGNGETQTYWMRMSINDKNEISYQIYNSYEEFNKK